MKPRSSATNGSSPSASPMASKRALPGPGRSHDAKLAHRRRLPRGRPLREEEPLRVFVKTNFVGELAHGVVERRLLTRDQAMTPLAPRAAVVARLQRGVERPVIEPVILALERSQRAALLVVRMRLEMRPRLPQQRVLPLRDAIEVDTAVVECRHVKACVRR